MRRLILLALLLYPLAAVAAPVRLDRQAPVPLDDALGALVDPTGRLTIDEVATRPLVPLADLHYDAGRWPGQQQARVWLGFSVEVLPGGQPWDLVIAAPFDPGMVYLEAPGGGFSPTPLVPAGVFRVPLDRPPGTWRAFIQVLAPLTRPSLLHLATRSGGDQLLAHHLGWQGVYLGVMLATLLVNLFVGLLLRDRVQLWYVAFIATSIATFSLFTGLVFATTPAGQLFRARYAGLALMILLGVAFSRRFLATARTAPRLDRVLLGFSLLSAAGVIAAFVLPDLIAVRVVAVLGLLVPAAAISAGVAALRTGSRWARFYLIGWSLFTVGGFVFAAFGFLGVFQLASLLEAVFFSVALADRMRILRAERSQAEQALARSQQLSTLGQVAAGVAHEINNPNNFISFNLPILEEYLAATRPHVEAAAAGDPGLRLVGLDVPAFYADAAKLTGHLKHGSERIAAIVSQLKGYARPAEEAQWEPASVNGVVERAAILVRPQLDRWAGRFELELDASLPPVRLAAGPIEQVVINLVLNAAQAARATPAARVDVRTRRRDLAVEIAVSDNGPGVPERLRGRIFEPFFTTKSSEHGTGMGLAISRRIIEEHGGTLELASAGPGDTCFVVRLPLAVEQP